MSAKIKTSQAETRTQRKARLYRNVGIGIVVALIGSFLVPVFLADDGGNSGAVAIEDALYSTKSSR